MNHCICIKNLTADTTEDQIRPLIYTTTQFIPLNVRIIKDKMSGLSRGFGFVDFETNEEAQNFLSMALKETAFSPFYLEFSHKREYKTATEHQDATTVPSTDTPAEQIYNDWICEFVLYSILNNLLV